MHRLWNQISQFICGIGTSEIEKDNQNNNNNKNYKFAFSDGSKSNFSNREIYINATYEIARQYYPYVYYDNRNISRHVVDLQAGFEVCYDFLLEVDSLVNEMTSISYTTFGLEQALMGALTELGLLRTEVRDLSETLTDCEGFNLSVLSQLKRLGKNMTDGIASGEQLLNNTKKQQIKMPWQGISKFSTAFMSLTTERYTVPKDTKKRLENVIHKSTIPKEMPNGGEHLSHLLEDQLAPNISRMQWLVDVQRHLTNKHSEFSFFLLGLWVESIKTNYQLTELKKVPSKRDNVAMAHRSDPPLLLANFGRIDEVITVLSNLQKSVLQLGQQITKELNRLRLTHTAMRKRYTSLTSEMTQRRAQLMECLLASHGAMQLALELNERNDALVGKLVKTRPIFAKLYGILQDKEGEADLKNVLSESSNESKSSGNSGEASRLREILGEKNWTYLVSKMAGLSTEQVKALLDM